MSPKQFIIRLGIFSILSISFLVSLNIWIDVYGLFTPAGVNGIKIYGDERTSKYLLAHRYVPENFDGYLIGPSLSANINPKRISVARIYNLSMMGANLTEQSVVLNETFKIKFPKFVIICLHPYITADHGLKTQLIDKKHYYGSIGSVSLYKTYLLAIIRYFDLLPNKYPKGQFNDFGYNNYNKIIQNMPVQKRIEEELLKDDAIKTEIDPIALLEFRVMINKLSSKGVRIIAYYHPLPYSLFKKYEESLTEYKSKINRELSGKATIIDFYSSEYYPFTKDFSNYIDHGHLSEKGQNFILDEIVHHSDLK